MKIDLAGFFGCAPGPQPMLLPPGIGVSSINQKPGRGDLRPWKTPLSVASVPAGTKSIYRMGIDAPSDTQYWLTWPSIVHAVKGAIADDTTERTYYTGDGFPKWTDNTMGLASAPYPTAWRQLGVPAPISAPIVTALAAPDVAAGSFVVGTGYTIVAPGTTDFTAIGAADSNIGTKFTATGVGSGTGTASENNPLAETRAYVYTYVTDKGEEGPPSPASNILDCNVNQPASISNLVGPPAGNFGITLIRIYKSETGSTGTDLAFLMEVPSTTTDTTDDLRALQESIATTTYLPPPSDLHHLIGLWNGMMAGISGNSFRFCEAYLPYAWPIAYDIIPPGCSPVAAGKFGQTFVGLTTGRPILMLGSSPDAMTEQPVDFLQACVSAESVVSMGYGVIWACPDGLAIISSDGPALLTKGIMTRDDWQAMNPSSIVGGIYEQKYIGFYTVGGITKGFMIDPLSPTGIYFLDIAGDFAFFDEIQDQLYLLSGTSIEKWDAGSLMTCTFRGKINHMPKPLAFNCAEVVADAYPVTLRIDAVNMDPAMVTKLVAADANLSAPTSTSVRYEVAVADNNPFRLPAGYLAQDWQLELQTTGAAIQGCVVAQSMAELAAS